MVAAVSGGLVQREREEKFTEKIKFILYQVCLPGDEKVYEVLFFL